jgi:molecular chaperone DnaK (HSP70)
MLADAERYASADKEKRENIDLKNQAETLCFEAEKELSLVKDSISTQKQESISKLIATIRQNSQNDQIDSLKSSLEELKAAMKEMVASKLDSESNSDPMSNLNDL